MQKPQVKTQFQKGMDTQADAIGKESEAEERDSAEPKDQERDSAELKDQDSFEPRRLLIVLHGKRAGDEGFEQAVKDLKADGHYVKVRVTYESGDVEEFVKEAINTEGDPFQTIVAAGGDGTLNEVVAAMIKYNAPETTSVALLPFGTANDFAAASGISQDPEEALEVAIDPDTIHPIDVGFLNGQVFMNTAGAGTSGAGVAEGETSNKLKHVLGPVAIFFSGVQKLLGSGMDPLHGVTLRYPTDDTRGGVGPEREVPGVDLLIAIAGNSRQVARTINVCPDALLDDGLLDVTIFTGSVQDQLSEVVGSVVTEGLQGATPGTMRTLRVPWLSITAPEDGPDLELNRDGEPTASSRTAKFEVKRHAVRMHLPDDRMLMSGRDGGSGGSGKRPKVKEGRLKPGKLKEMLTDIKVAPGRWKRAIPGLKFAAMSLLPAGLLGALLGYTAATAGQLRTAERS